MLVEIKRQFLLNKELSLLFFLNGYSTCYKYRAALRHDWMISESLYPTLCFTMRSIHEPKKSFSCSIKVACPLSPWIVFTIIILLLLFVVVVFHTRKNRT